MTVLAALAWVLGAAEPAAPSGVHLPVPLVRQEPARCGSAALRMALVYWRAGDVALREADRAYDPVLRGVLITDLVIQ